ncbi:MAG: hypothetical protein DSY90_05925 [Deltaproteobacteria bacterium]|nr:MAG: hypothetical protein DSY90_05925 [Deltaproteobacteria bacterium]
MSNIQKYHPYTFSADSRISEEQMATLIGHLNSSRQPADTILGGRTRLVSLDLPGYGPVLVKPYLRGGLIRHVNRRTHIRWGTSRPRAEFDRLNQVRQIGVNAPDPVVVITRGGRFYQGWLVTRFIEQCRSLAELSRIDPVGARAVLDDLGRQVAILIDHRILHTDLHPGNVLVGPGTEVYLIDFDKTRTDIRNRLTLRRRYRKRWHRAIVKYKLPTWLDAAMDID